MLSGVKPNWVMMKEGVFSIATARRSENSTSRAVTGLPDWNVSPSRILKVMVLPSSETSQLAGD